mmetsp:Transcript_7106/g.15510  ORF Transcript_7106/g.15510 Transcript_7106/m.15510 type:complete len:228 (-) Transcript_7106:82-765(-)
MAPRLWRREHETAVLDFLVLLALRSALVMMMMMPRALNTAMAIAATVTPAPAIKSATAVAMRTALAVERATCLASAIAYVCVRVRVQLRRAARQVLRPTGRSAGLCARARFVSALRVFGLAPRAALVFSCDGLKFLLLNGSPCSVELLHNSATFGRSPGFVCSEHFLLGTTKDAGKDWSLLLLCHLERSAFTAPDHLKRRHAMRHWQSPNHVWRCELMRSTRRAQRV